MDYQKQKQYRLPGYDYSQPGEYFITICTKDRQHLFGGIQQSTIQLSDAGLIAKTHLIELPRRFDHVLLDEWVIMPNHIHMILMIDKDCRNLTVRRAINQVPTDQIPTKSGIPNNPMELPQNTVGKMIRWYKGRVTYECRKQKIGFSWQARFHDHIIRSKRSLEDIRQYIQDNPLRWQDDVFNSHSSAYYKNFNEVFNNNLL